MKDKLALLKEKVYQLMQVTVSGLERAIGFRHVFLRFLKEERRASPTSCYLTCS